MEYGVQERWRWRTGDGGERIEDGDCCNRIWDVRWNMQEQIWNMKDRKRRMGNGRG